MSETPQERQEKARVRRRWLTLGELIAIAGVLISALALWNSYRERTTSEARQTADATTSAHKAAVLVLRKESSGSLFWRRHLASRIRTLLIAGVC